MPHDSVRSRRDFLKTSGALIAGGTLLPPAVAAGDPADKGTAALNKIRHYRKLGRTGFQVSDISMGCGNITSSDVVRYAYDHGVNYFDVAENYGNGDSERKIGEALPHLDRKRIFITTKLTVRSETTLEEILDTFRGSLQRLQTDYVDALFMHSVKDTSLLAHPHYHAAVEQLKSEGRLRFSGLSSHGPRTTGLHSMDQVLCAAAEDGRFDVMLLIYNFLNKDEGERILAACKANDVGSSAMKIVPGQLVITPFDEENPADEYREYIELRDSNGFPREETIERIQNWLADLETTRADLLPFAEKYGIETNKRLNQAAVQWTLKDPRMHTACVSLPDFETIEQYLPVSGIKLSLGGERFLDDYERAHGHRYCRHACTDCEGACPSQVPVSTIMRYTQYYERQGREKHAMSRYAALQGNALPCFTCSAPCSGACKHGVSIQAGLVRAHSLLTMA
ncbi:MAG: aldo/keto reductase [bacterium]|nr:aldo/keto reductase [bacterium]